MTRVNVVTGAASGIGKATTELLRSRGETVITADIQNADIVADLSTEDGRAFFVSEVERLANGKLDAVHAIAGLATPTAATVAVNYYGAIASVEPLLPLLAASDAPRVVITSSIASYLGEDEKLLELILTGTEADATTEAEAMAGDPDRASKIYNTTKFAITRWIRTNAIKPEWAGQGIALNGVGPGIIRTPMTEQMLADEGTLNYLKQTCPAPLNGPAADPMWIAAAHVFLGSAENMFITGQVLFADGGAEATTRTERV